MLSRLKEIASDTLIYGISGSISKMIGVFLVPIYTSVFSPADYGKINIINQFLLIFGLLAVFGLDSASARWFYDTSLKEDRKRVIASRTYFQIGASLFFLGLMLISTPLVNTYLFDGNEGSIALVWITAAFLLLTKIFPSVLSSWYRFQRDPKAVMIFSLTKSVLTIAVTYLFVVILAWQIQGVFLAQLIVGALFSLVAIAVLRDWLKPSDVDGGKLKEMIRFGAPLVPAAIAVWSLSSINSFFLLFYFDDAEVGLFTVGLTIASFVMLFTSAFQQAWGPFAFSIIQEDDARDTYANVFHVYSVLAGFLILGMFLFSLEALMIFTQPEYFEAHWVASLMSISFIATSFTYIANLGLNIVKTNRPYAKAVFVAAGINMVFVFTLVPVLGKEGSALGILCSQAAIPLYLFLQSQRVYHIPYDFRKAILVMLLAALLGLSGKVFIQFDSFWVGVVAKMGILMSFTLIMAMMHRKELKLLLSKIPNI